ncbi:MAG: transcriptional repressor [Gammaproteobacteria bacterium]|nr:transcriptional repressor [Gammaproteobacteria bacterium]
MKQKILSAFPDAAHDHVDCVRDAIAAAESVCGSHKARLTPLRKTVLGLVWDSHKPAGAYDILEQLRAERDRVAPATVYRALDFLIEHGLIHRIESLNAFVGCSDPRNPHSGQFMICQRCKTVAELADPDIHRAVEQRARSLGFAVDRQTVEVIGVCDACAASTG